MIFLTLSRIIDEIESHCANKIKGCKWEGEFGNLVFHLNECSFESVPCDACQFIVLRQNLKHHHTNECIQRVVVCQHCQIQFLHSGIEAHKGSIVDFKWTANKLIEKCEETISDCPFEIYGCEEKIARKNIDNHVNSPKHIRILLKEIVSLNEKVRKLEQLSKKNF